MKLKMIYTGRPEETRIVNAETGEPIQNVTSVHIEVDAFGCNALIHVREIEIDIDQAEGMFTTYDG